MIIQAISPPETPGCVLSNEYGLDTSVKGQLNFRHLSQLCWWLQSVFNTGSGDQQRDISLPVSQNCLNSRI